MKMKTYHAPNSGISAYAEGQDYIIVRFKTGERYRYDARKPGREHVAEMKSRAHRTSGLTTYINQHIRENYARKLDDTPMKRPIKRRVSQAKQKISASKRRRRSPNSSSSRRKSPGKR